MLIEVWEVLAYMTFTIIFTTNGICQAFPEKNAYLNSYLQ